MDVIYFFGNVWNFLDASFVPDKPPLANVFGGMAVATIVVSIFAHLTARNTSMSRQFAYSLIAVFVAAFGVAVFFLAPEVVGFIGFWGNILAAFLEACVIAFFYALAAMVFIIVRLFFIKVSDDKDDKIGSLEKYIFSFLTAVYICGFLMIAVKCLVVAMLPLAIGALIIWSFFYHLNDFTRKRTAD